MVRAPALELINYLKCSNHRMPSIRYIIFGRAGSGKTCSLMHVLHFCGQEKYLIFHVPWLTRFTRYHWDKNPSPYNSKYVDRPHDGLEMLTHFKNLNEPLLREINMVCSKQYIWNKREFADAGTPILDMIQFGLSRPKYACDIVSILIKEIRLQADKGDLPPILVAVEGVNAAWGISGWCKNEIDGKLRNVDDINIVRNIKKLLSNDWRGASIVSTVDTNAVPHESRSLSYMPQALLQKDGFNFFEPHIGIHIPHYSDKEIRSCLDYYSERKWIQNPGGFTKDGRNEITFLSGYNPQELINVTSIY